MTAQEQKSINQIAMNQNAQGVEQATMKANQVNMADDIKDIKDSIKELVKGHAEILRSLEGKTLANEKKFVKKVDAKWYVGAIISLATLYILLLNYIHSIK